MGRVSNTEVPKSESRQVDPAVYKTLLESTKAIPWRIDWTTMKFSYIGPQIEPLLGWSPESWMTVNDWAERIHVEDRERVVNFCVAQSKAGVDHEADYRALTKDGSYVWIRDVVHVVRNPAGEVDALVGFMFDISERKRTEEKVMRLQRELEALSFLDGLTGLANRRRYDMLVGDEWKLAAKTSEPISILLVDIDHFKLYNDHYGHVRGDECLKRVAEALTVGATRPRDIVARYGGEEFVIVLPETDAAGAVAVAERCRNVLSEESIPHDCSGTAPIVTVSIGVGTITPREGDDLVRFVEEVDRCLYGAKQRGRNSIVIRA
jgi:diguanylate cyclase (GGDEF)-like protein/PAS domain S-box-containing protein